MGTATSQNSKAPGVSNTVEFEQCGFRSVAPAPPPMLKTDLMKPSEALAAHRDELRQLVSRYNVTHPRVYGSVLTGKEDEESDLGVLVDATLTTTLLTLWAGPFLRSSRPRATPHRSNRE